jgi:3'-5' exoribonuclease
MLRIGSSLIAKERCLLLSSNEPYPETAIENWNRLDVATQGLPTKLQVLCDHVLDNEAFTRSPGGATVHHAYEHGLLQHTAEVVEYTRVLSGDYKYVDAAALITAAIWHDFHKIYEYEIEADGKIKKLEYRLTIGHVTGSVIEFVQQATKLDMKPEQIDQIVHIMLAHHGRLEWRSPVEPRTKEAFILHAADMLSARG